MTVPAKIDAHPRVSVITETVVLAIPVGDHPPIRLEVCRLVREPHILILPVDPKFIEVTRTDEGEQGFASFHIKIASACTASP